MRVIRAAIARAHVSRLCRAPAQLSDSWARWDHIAYNGVADSEETRKGEEKGQRAEERKGKRDAAALVGVRKDRCNMTGREIEASLIRDCGDLYGPRLCLSV